MISATYISTSSFKVSGDKTLSFSEGRRVKTNCGVDGSIYITVLSSLFDGTDTTINCRESTLTSNLTEVLFGTLDAGLTGSLPAHTHADDTQGGALVGVDMVGASPTVAGTHGLVPAPTAGTILRVLHADATWSEVDVESAADIKRLAIIYG